MENLLNVREKSGDFKVDDKWQPWVIFPYLTTFSVSYELSHPMAKTEFPSTNKKRTNYVS